MPQQLDFKQIAKPDVQAFNIDLAHGSSLAVSEVVRVIPDRRLVCRGRWNGQAVYAKIFLGRNAKRYALRDKQGVNALQVHNIYTPALLHEFELDDGTYILLFLALESADNAEKIWCEIASQSRIKLAFSLVKTLAKHHLAGLTQTDLHLKNFLVQSQASGEINIYTLDGDGIRRLRRVFTKSQRLANLATLFSKFDVLDDVLIPELYRSYCIDMNLPYSAHDLTRVIILTQKIRQRVSHTYADKKVFRNCTDVKVDKSFGQYRALTSSFLIGNQTLSGLDSWLVDANINIKNGNTCTVGVAELSNQQVVIKRYNIKSCWHFINRALRQSRAAVSWANAHRLIIANIATPKPLALLEQRWGFLRGRAYFLSTYLDAPDVAQFYAQAPIAEAQSCVAQNLAMLFFKLYLLQYTHGDCKASNIKIVDLQPVLLDLDSMHAHTGCWARRWFFERKHIKDLKRLMQNWQHDAKTTAILKHAFQSVYANKAKAILIRAGII